MKELIIRKIDRVEMMVVRIPFVSPFETSFSVQREREAMLVRLSAGGESGWGECVAGSDPFYSYETNATAASIIKAYLVPMLIQSLPAAVEEVNRKFSRVRGHLMAKAAVENALLDLVAKEKGLPLFRILGGEEKRIMSGISLGIQDKIEVLLQAIAKALKNKYDRIKIKIKRGRDVEVVRRVRERYPDIRLMIDANSDYTLADLPVLKQLDEFGLMMIEQPLGHDDIWQHARLQQELQTPICLDESIHTLADAETAVGLKSCRIINIKQGRVGGLLSARDIQDFCRRQGIPVWSGGMLETGIGRAANIHLQTLPGFILPGDTSETSRYFAEEITEPPVALTADGMISIPPGAGIGITVVERLLKKYSVFQEILYP